MTFRGVAALLIAMALVGCAGPKIEPLMPTPVLYSELDLSPLDNISEDQRWKPRKVYYATTRQRDADLQRINYGNDESDVISAGMSLIGFGGDSLTWSDLRDYSRSAERPSVVELSVAGLLEAGRFRPSMEGPVSENAAEGLAWLMSDMNRSIASARDKDLLIYVHGAKVNFYNANAFAAQLDHFMGRDMTSIAFSWPTRQNILSYGIGDDVDRAYRAAPSLASLIEVLARQSDARRINIVCWSAGGRVVTSALEELYTRNQDSGQDPREQFRLGTVYFAAADVPTSDFVEALPEINSLVDRVVVTLSSKDGALDMGSTFMGGGARIGQKSQDLTEEALNTLIAADRLEVIDVSRDWEGRGFDITGHRYWINHPWASSDLVLAVRSDLRAKERGLEPTEFDVLWAIPADYPERLKSLLTREGMRLREVDSSDEAN
ncbi:alpha/beta hydrolase [Congregibacter sp.]|uniref:alpha/beta hydrolase n=1 Tax=Congregibacter sp. TaxID=2744308 RepID=UPI003859D40C